MVNVASQELESLVYTINNKVGTKIIVSINDTELPKIMLDFDDTFVKSSEQIIKMICERTGAEKTIDDLTDWCFQSISTEVTPKEVLGMFQDDVFFEEVELNTGVSSFLTQFKDRFHFVFCTKGSEKNLFKKLKMLDTIFQEYEMRNNYSFYGIVMEENNNSSKLDKSCIDLSDCILCVDDNTHALLSMNVGAKTLIKNHREQEWNKTPINNEQVYVVNDFYDVADICEFVYETLILKEGLL